MIHHVYKIIDIIYYFSPYKCVKSGKCAPFLHFGTLMLNVGVHCYFVAQWISDALLKFKLTIWFGSSLENMFIDFLNQL